MRWFAVLALLLAPSAARALSDRAALNLAIAATRGGPPDLSALIVKHRKEYLTGVREAARRSPPPAVEREAREIARSIVARTPLAEAVRRTGALVGGVLAAEVPAGAGEGIDAASAGPYRIAGVTAASAAGDPAPVAASISRARADLDAAHAGPEDAAARVVYDATNLLWAIWTAAGGDARAAKNFDERNGPYLIAGAPR
jgi:hypothetical protein